MDTMNELHKELDNVIKMTDNKKIPIEVKVQMITENYIVINNIINENVELETVTKQKLISLVETSIKVNNIIGNSLLKKLNNYKKLEDMSKEELIKLLTHKK